MTSIAILHYMSPPTVGGVESTIYYHARELTRLGYTVRVISGVGESFNSRIETCIYPLFSSKHPQVLAVKHELDCGEVPPAFETLVEQMLAQLKQGLSGCDVCIVHNALTLHKNLPLTAALARYHETHPVQLIAWCHDLAWTNPQYLPELHDGYPWDILRQRWPDVIYVTVSEPRRDELAALLNMPEDDVGVVVPGVDPAEFYHWTPITAMLAERLELLDTDGLLLLSARLTRRKNIALAVRVLAALRELTGQDFRLIVTGPPGPNNPANMGYLGELLELRHDLGVDETAHFLYAYGEGDAPLIPDYATIANLYHMADALFFPSLQEGFGISVLEAGFAGIPIFCSNISPFRVSGQEDVHFFDPVHDPPAKIAKQIAGVLNSSPVHRLRTRVRKGYRWETIVREQVVPLLRHQ